MHVLRIVCRSYQYRSRFGPLGLAVLMRHFCRHRVRKLKLKTCQLQSHRELCQERQGLLTTFFEELCTVLNGKYSAARSLVCVGA